MDRRSFSSGALALSTAAWSTGALAATARAKRNVLFASVGNRIMNYDIDTKGATLVKRGEIALPSPIQYAWPHPAKPLLYVCTGVLPASGKEDEGVYRLCAVKIAPDGTLSLHGEPAILRQRPIHNSVDASGRFVLTAYNIRPEATVHSLRSDGTIGPEVPQHRLDVGIFPHQIRSLPNSPIVSIVSRGINAAATKPEDPGSLNLFRLDKGALVPLAKLAPGGKGGLGYGPRHLDFHPIKPWAYVTLERQNRIHMHQITPDGFSPEPLFVQSTTEPVPAGRHQVLGTIHVHPKGHVLYTANRANGAINFGGNKVFAGGDNSIMVYALDPQTGEPRPIQKVDAHGIHVRAFTIDPTGTLLVAPSMVEMLVREDDGKAVKLVPAGLSLFRIAPDGTLEFVRKYDISLKGSEQIMWTRAMAI